MSKVNYLFDILTINKVIEDNELDIKLEDNELDIDKLFSNLEFIKHYKDYRKQFNTKECVDELNDNIILRYKDNESNDRIINIVDFILDILYNNEYITEYQMLYIIRCINDKLSNILFENIIDNLTDSNNIEMGIINDIIENEIY